MCSTSWTNNQLQPTLHGMKGQCFDIQTQRETRIQNSKREDANRDNYRHKHNQQAELENERKRDWGVKSKRKTDRRRKYTDTNRFLHVHKRRWICSSLPPLMHINFPFPSPGMRFTTEMWWAECRACPPTPSRQKWQQNKWTQCFLWMKFIVKFHDIFSGN